MYARSMMAAVAAAALPISGPVFAQGIAPTLVVAFTGVPAASVPLDPWTSVAAALLVAAIAGAVLRRRRAGRPGLWLALIAAAAGAVAGALHLDAITSAQALITEIPLSTSPASLVIGSAFATRDLNARNVTGQPIRIVSVVLNDPAPGETIVTPPTTCVPGLVLAPNQTCLIEVTTIDE